MSELINRVNVFIDDILEQVPLLSQVMFSVNSDTELSANRRETKKREEKFKSFFQSLEGEKFLALDCYVYVTSSKYTNHFAILCSLFNFGIAEGLFTTSCAFRSLLTCNTLVFDNGDFWCFAFEKVNALLPEVEWKTARKGFKVILDVASKIQVNENYNEEQEYQMECVRKVLEACLDKTNNLFCGYLLYIELCLKIPEGEEGKYYPHLMLSDLISVFIESFRPVAQMVSISGFLTVRWVEREWQESRFLPVIGHKTIGNLPQLDIETGKMCLTGILPYYKELLEPQTSLIRFVLGEPHSRWTVCEMLGITGQIGVNYLLEKQFAELIILTMKRSKDESIDDGTRLQFFWQNLSSQFLYLISFNLINYFNIVNILLEKLSHYTGEDDREWLHKSRDNLMWLLLQFLSESMWDEQIQFRQYYPVLDICDLLCRNTHMLPLADYTKASCVRTLARLSIWYQLVIKAYWEGLRFQEFPVSLVHQRIELNQNHFKSIKYVPSEYVDYRKAILSNTDPCGKMLYVQSMSVQQQEKLFEKFIWPLHMSFLDSLTHHIKKLLLQHLTEVVMQIINSNVPNKNIVPAMAETYSRLMIYYEMENIGIKEFACNFLTVFQSPNWNILHTFLEMLSYRLHKISIPFHAQIISTLHYLSDQSDACHVQIRLCIENTLLKFLAGMEILDIKHHYETLKNEGKSLFSDKSVEFNKVLVLNIARAVHMTGTQLISEALCQEIINAIMRHTPHTWTAKTLKCFPKVLAQAYDNQPQEQDVLLVRRVNDEYQTWLTLNDDQKVNHFSTENSNVFICLIWKMLLRKRSVPPIPLIPPIAFKVLNRIDDCDLAPYIRVFADFLIIKLTANANHRIKETLEFKQIDGRRETLIENRVMKRISIVSDMIWVHHVMPLDRFLLYLSLRKYEGRLQMKTCFFIVKTLLMNHGFQRRVESFVENNSAEHWEHYEWYRKNGQFHGMFQERFHNEEHLANSINGLLPPLFGNVCLRFLPVLDILIHRCIEFKSLTSAFSPILKSIGRLYRFHDRPLSFVYHTLYYYEKTLKACPKFKKAFVSAIIGGFDYIRPEGWALSQYYIDYSRSDSNVKPPPAYYTQLVERFAKTIAGNGQFFHTDWRFNEFSNERTHGLFITCIELMALTISTRTVANALLDVTLKKQSSDDIYIGVVVHASALLLITLPRAFLDVFSDRILKEMKSPLFTNNTYGINIFTMVDFTGNYNSMSQLPCAYMIALSHSVFYHANSSQFHNLIQTHREKIWPVVKTEEQFLFVCHLIAPFFQRIHGELESQGMEIITALHNMLLEVDRNCEELRHMDSICNFLYHIHSGNFIPPEDDKFLAAIRKDILKNLRESILVNLREDMRRKLRFILVEYK